jgi:hypothetical protein
MKDDFVTPPAQLITTVSMSNSKPISSITMSAADSSVTSAPAKKVKIIRSTATTMQMCRMAALEKKKGSASVATRNLKP